MKHVSIIDALETAFLPPPPPPLLPFLFLLPLSAQHYTCSIECSWYFYLLRWDTIQRNTWITQKFQILPVIYDTRDTKTNRINITWRWSYSSLSLSVSATWMKFVFFSGYKLFDVWWNIFSCPPLCSTYSTIVSQGEKKGKEKYINFLYVSMPLSFFVYLVKRKLKEICFFL